MKFFFLKPMHDYTFLKALVTLNSNFTLKNLIYPPWSNYSSQILHYSEYPISPLPVVTDISSISSASSPFFRRSRRAADGLLYVGRVLVWIAFSRHAWFSNRLRWWRWVGCRRRWPWRTPGIHYFYMVGAKTFFFLKNLIILDNLS